jgi:hypothetical protein
VLPEVLSLWTIDGGVAEVLDQLRCIRQRITVDLAIHTALIGMFAVEQECVAMAAPVWLSSRVGPEHGNPHVLRPVSGEL